MFSLFGGGGAREVLDGLAKVFLSRECFAVEAEKGGETLVGLDNENHLVVGDARGFPVLVEFPDEVVSKREDHFTIVDSGGFPVWVGGGELETCSVLACHALGLRERW